MFQLYYQFRWHSGLLISVAVVAIVNRFNSLTHVKILDLSKFKVFVEENSSIAPIPLFDIVLIEQKTFWKKEKSLVTRISIMVLTLSKTSPYFYVSAVQVLKILWEKKKLHVLCNFSFSHSVFYPFG